MELHGLKLLVRQKPAVKGAQGCPISTLVSSPGFLRTGNGKFLQGGGSFTAVNGFFLDSQMIIADMPGKVKEKCAVFPLDTLL